jgi:EAL domain-containing protein (putative c-di-GMP-specific phosphodiesterase class I)/GGDEF domain-containing protein
MAPHSIWRASAHRPSERPLVATHHLPTVHDRGWDDVLEDLDVAFQPIVNIHTGACYGYEALLRGYQAAGFDSPQDVFDVAHTLNVLAKVDLVVREKAIAKFARLPNRHQAKLFLNIDNRTLGRNSEAERRTRSLLDARGLASSTVAFEISERHPLGQAAEAVAAFKSFRSGGFRLAIDDFGTGFSGLQMLYFAEPDFLKIDRFFVSDIANDAKKKLFLAQIVNIAHLLGVVVIAEGVECEREYFVCKEIGCDLVQGYMVQRPTTEVRDLHASYETVAELGRRERRTVVSDHRLIDSQIDSVPPLSIDTPMERVFEAFRADTSRSLFPVVDAAGEPVGVVRERELKEFAYSRFGQALMSNRGLGRRLKDFVVRCPVADINAKAENIMQAYTADQSTDGIVIVDGMKYIGFLSADSLLRVINEKNLATARDQNPLTKLPGNNAIHEYISDALEDVETDYVLAYFDFDNFKPFNDSYGFRLGDRAILLFAELMAKLLPRDGRFGGHIGGDDFFAGFKGVPLADCQGETAALIERFGRDVESFYDDATRRRGYISGVDRQGKACRFSLLGVSVAVLHLPAGRTVQTTDAISQQIAGLKKEAKGSPLHMALAEASARSAD